MFKTILAAVTVLGALAAAPATAAPVVAVDIPPVHSLVARVMEGIGEPSLIVRPGASPHGYAMRPSEAALLERAEVVFWVGGALTPWLERALSSLATEAAVVELMGVEGIERLGFREGAMFKPHDHGHDHAHGGHHDHDHGHDHSHDGVDPHVWLDPANAAVWLGAIAAALSEADPENAARYARNAEAGQAELAALIAEIEADLAPLRGRGFIVFHDAYRYFEHRFGIEAAGAIAVSDAAAPSPARVADIRAAIEGMDAACVFAEPQFEPALVETVTEGTGARTGVLDPLGATLEPSPALYPTLLRNLADSLVGCLSD